MCVHKCVHEHVHMDVYICVYLCVCACIHIGGQRPTSNVGSYPLPLLRGGVCHCAHQSSWRMSLWGVSRFHSLSSYRNAGVGDMSYCVGSGDLSSGLALAGKGFYAVSHFP